MKKNNKIKKAATMTTIGMTTAAMIAVEMKKADNEEARKKREREEKVNNLVNLFSIFID